MFMGIFSQNFTLMSLILSKFYLKANARGSKIILFMVLSIIIGATHPNIMKVTYIVNFVNSNYQAKSQSYLTFCLGVREVKCA